MSESQSHALGHVHDHTHEHGHYHENVADAKTVSKTRYYLRTYKPLILAASVIIVATYLLELARSHDGLVLIHEVMNTFMGFFFLVFGLMKVFNTSGFAEAFSKYDPISKRYKGYAKVYPFIEIELGLILLSNYPTNSWLGNNIVNTIIVILTGLGLYGITNSLRKKEDLHCACLGASVDLPLSKVAVFENGLMFIMALSMLFFLRSFHLIVVSLTHFRIVH